jgi:hypothetical protein
MPIVFWFSSSFKLHAALKGLVDAPMLSAALGPGDVTEPKKTKERGKRGDQAAYFSLERYSETFNGLVQQLEKLWYDEQHMEAVRKTLWNLGYTNSDDPGPIIDGSLAQPSNVNPIFPPDYPGRSGPSTSSRHALPTTSNQQDLDASQIFGQEAAHALGQPEGQGLALPPAASHHAPSAGGQRDLDASEIFRQGAAYTLGQGRGHALPITSIGGQQDLDASHIFRQDSEAPYTLSQPEGRGLAPPFAHLSQDQAWLAGGSVFAENSQGGAGGTEGTFEEDTIFSRRGAYGNYAPSYRYNPWQYRND